ncbi:MAG: PBP1A family penicillin-binding protein [Alphaproteobacteria bacterium]|nr:PBP1A family penicillin-binding protein [Alphaproteobacteria bacterium]
MKRRYLVLLVLLAVGLPSAEAVLRDKVVPELDQRLTGIDDWRPPTVVRVFAKGGDQVDEFALVRREWVDIDDLPDVAWQAIVAAEDRRFFEHGGFDPIGIARAMWVNLAAGSIREGGSTLTQQLVKNVVVGSEKSYARKAEEALLAWRLEARISKRKVLELYLNFVYLGSGNYGLEAASQDYFGISARDLDAGQAAMLAGLIPAPSSYSPRRNPEVAAERRRIVLNAMVDLGMVDVLDAQLYKRAPIDPPRRDGSTSATGTAYLTNVRREVRRLFGTELPFQVGLQVFTPLDPVLQRAAEKGVRDAAAAVEQRQGIPAATRRLSWSEVPGFLEVAAGLGRTPDGDVEEPTAGDCFDAVYATQGKVRAGPYTWRLSDASWWQRIWNPDSEIPAQPLAYVARWGDVLRVCVDAARGSAAPTVSLERTPWVEGAAVVIENATGHVVAMVGGRDMPLEGFNRATQGRRQAGSSFKPYVYAAAIDAGASQVDDVLDAPLFLDAGHGQVWSPKNSSGRYYGHVSMRFALANSLNTVAVRLALQAGVDRIAAIASRAGVRSPLRKDLTLALGSSEVTPMDQAVGIASFPRGGRALEPVFVERLEDVRGVEVGRAGSVARLEGRQVRLPGGDAGRVVAPATAYQVVDLMRGVIRDGTGRSAFVPTQDRAGKTGTTSAVADAWFVGYTPAYTAVVWIGRDDRQTLGHGESGARAALPAWRTIMDALPDDGGARIQPPSDVVLVPYGDSWVGLAATGLPDGVLTWTAPGPEPLPEFPTPEPKACAEDQAHQARR